MCWYLQRVEDRAGVGFGFVATICVPRGLAACQCANVLARFQAQIRNQHNFRIIPRANVGAHMDISGSEALAKRDLIGFVEQLIANQQHWMLYPQRVNLRKLLIAEVAQIDPEDLDAELRMQRLRVQLFHHGRSE